MLTQKGRTMTDSIEQLLFEVASKGKLRPTFVITALGPGNHPYVFEAGDIALGAINMAKRKRNQDGYRDVTILRWAKAAAVYADDDELCKRAFGVIGLVSNGDLAEKRRIRSALDVLEMSVHKIKVAGDYDYDSRQALARAFLECYHSMGGESDELISLF